MNIFEGWIFLKGEYFSGKNILQGLIFLRGEYFFGLLFLLKIVHQKFSTSTLVQLVTLVHKWVHCLPIISDRFRIRADYFGLLYPAFHKYSKGWVFLRTTSIKRCFWHPWKKDQLARIGGRGVCINLGPPRHLILLGGQILLVFVLSLGGLQFVCFPLIGLSRTRC